MKNAVQEEIKRCAPQSTINELSDKIFILSDKIDATVSKMGDRNQRMEEMFR